MANKLTPGMLGMSGYEGHKANPFLVVVLDIDALRHTDKMQDGALYLDNKGHC